MTITEVLAKLPKRLKLSITKSKGVMIFGNHSTTQYPCINHIKVKGQPIAELVDQEWLQTTYISKVQKRGGEVL